jgi:hypothetical protein
VVAEAAMPNNDPNDSKQVPKDRILDDERRQERSSNDRDQQLERERTTGRGEMSRDRKTQDTDPDSPDADVNRDDMIDEP